MLLDPAATNWREADPSEVLYAARDGIPQAVQELARREKGVNLTAVPAATVDLAADPVFATTDGPNLTLPAAPHRYHHGWVRIDAAGPGAVERATRAAMTDGHAMLHGAGMATTARKVIERMKSAGHHPTVSRMDVGGTPHLHIARQPAGASLTAAATRTVDLAFTESLHPRAPKGTAAGGQFAAGSGSSAPPKGVQANVRDFQRRHGLTQTGRYDAATRAAVAKAQAPATGGGKGKSAKKAAKAKRAGKGTATRANHAATAAAVNRLSNVQRAQFRILRPAPPKGYHWTADNHLVRSTPQARAIARILTGK